MNMTSVQAKKVVLISVLLLGAIGAYRGQQGESRESVARRLWGVGVLWVMLGLLADVAPQLAGPFALLAVLGSLTAQGDQAIQRLLGNLGVEPEPGGGNSARPVKPTPDTGFRQAPIGGPATGPHAGQTR